MSKNNKIWDYFCFASLPWQLLLVAWVVSLGNINFNYVKMGLKASPTGWSINVMAYRDICEYTWPHKLWCLLVPKQFSWQSNSGTRSTEWFLLLWSVNFQLSLCWEQSYSYSKLKIKNVSKKSLRIVPEILNLLLWFQIPYYPLVWGVNTLRHLGWTKKPWKFPKQDNGHRHIPKKET